LKHGILDELPKVRTTGRSKQNLLYPIFQIWLMAKIANVTCYYAMDVASEK
jgi:hypothetical protein